MRLENNRDNKEFDVDRQRSFQQLLGRGNEDN